LKELLEISNSDDPHKVCESVIANILWQMDKDRKTPGLKSLQSKIWEYGYHSGELKGVIYEDVKTAIDKWKELKIPIYIYSSGSVDAQKLLFGFSTFGDLNGYISGNFDLVTCGNKLETESYKKIIKHLNISPAYILFVTDNIKEAQAAQIVGIQTILADRPGNKPILDAHTFSVITNFMQLLQTE